jgi:hypothetical protein
MKTLESKLTAGVRQVMSGKPAGDPTMPAPAPTTPVPARPATAGSTQNPPVTLYRPWSHLHPARIWPD